MKTGYVAFRASVVLSSSLALMLAPGLPASQSSGTPAVLSGVEPPPGAKGAGIQWMTVTSPGVGVMLAAVTTPPGPGPFTTVVILHGSHGFAHEYVALATALADRGVQAMAACWFSGSSGGAGARFVTPIACPQAPPMPMASSKEALDTVDTLLQAARQLPGTRQDRVALFGHSRGGGAALNYVLERSGAYAAILNSTGYPPEVTAAAGRVRAPVLLLHGTADDPADGGSGRSSIAMAREFEAAVRRAGKPIDAHYYAKARHNEIFTNATQRADEVRRILEFLQRPSP
jgi:dienelactone hydrolase